MQTLVWVLFLGFLAGCAGHNPENSRLPDADLQFIEDFLNALCRTPDAKFRVVIDRSASGECLNTSHEANDLVLRKRLANLRKGARQLCVGVSSNDGAGSSFFSYTSPSGRLARIEKPAGKNAAWHDMFIFVIHQNDGTTCLKIVYSGFADGINDIFHLRSGERVFRYAMASEAID